MYKSLFLGFICVFGILSHPCSGYAQAQAGFPMPNGKYQTKVNILPSDKYPNGASKTGQVEITGTGPQRSLALHETLNYVDAAGNQVSTPSVWQGMWTADGGKVYYSEQDDSVGQMFSAPITTNPGGGFETILPRYSNTVGQMIEFKGVISLKGSNEYLDRNYYKDTNGNWQLYAERTYTRENR